MYFNGASTTSLMIKLTGTVAASDVYVFAHSLANATILAQADQTNGEPGLFNGDDALVLVKAGQPVDAIGQVGFDPGTEWGSGLTSTADNTLRRKGDIECGDIARVERLRSGRRVGWLRNGYVRWARRAHVYRWHVQRVSMIAPSVTSTTPANGATGVPGTTDISVTFSEPVAVADGWYSINCTHER